MNDGRVSEIELGSELRMERPLCRRRWGRDWMKRWVDERMGEKVGGGERVKNTVKEQISRREGEWHNG